MDVTRRCAFTLAVAQTPPAVDETVSQQEKEETRIAYYKQQLRAQVIAQLFLRLRFQLFELLRQPVLSLRQLLALPLELRAVIDRNYSAHV